MKRFRENFSLSCDGNERHVDISSFHSGLLPAKLSMIKRSSKACCDSLAGHYLIDYNKQHSL
jgi:hypothetical protein